MDTPEASIVIPCYNGQGSLLRQAVQSALDQESAETEVIVVDDGSTEPETIAAIDDLPGNVRVIRQGNKGLPAARNRGIEAARGRYVLPLDCDDWIEPQFVRRALRLIDGREDAFVYPWIQTFGENDVLIRKQWDPFKILWASPISSFVFMPKALWRRIGRYDETMTSGAEDWDFNIRLALEGIEALCIAEPLFHYRVSIDGMFVSTVLSRTIRDNLYFFYKVYRKYSGHWLRRRIRPTDGAHGTRRYPTWFLLLHRLIPRRIVMMYFTTYVILDTLLRHKRRQRSYIHRVRMSENSE